MIGSSHSYQHARETYDAVFVIAFTGKSDHAGGACGVIEYLEKPFDAVPYARIDAELYTDFQFHNPQINTKDPAKSIVWPESTVSYSGKKVLSEKNDGLPLYLVRGVEPNINWLKYINELDNIIERFNNPLIIMLSAVSAEVPHTKPIPVTVGLHPRKDNFNVMLGQVFASNSPYEGPIGISGLLLAKWYGIYDLISLWAQVPFYFYPYTPAIRGEQVFCPPVTLALIKELSALLRTEFDISELVKFADEWREEFSRNALDNPELLQNIETCEKKFYNQDG